MDTQITARNFDVSSTLQDHVHKRLSKLERFYDGHTNAHVILQKGNDPAAGKEAEINLNVRQQRLCAQGTASSYEKAVDDCIERIRRQLLRYKDKRHSNDKDAYR